jgi:hypothetical protein
MVVIPVRKKYGSKTKATRTSVMDAIHSQLETERPSRQRPFLIVGWYLIFDPTRGEEKHQSVDARRFMIRLPIKSDFRLSSEYLPGKTNLSVFCCASKGSAVYTML